jgi:hypothetical protein
MMTDSEIFSKLFNGGRYSLPYLVRFSAPGQADILLVNARRDVEYSGRTYRAASFKYTPPDKDGKGGRLTGGMAGTDLIPFLDAADWKMTVDVTGLLMEDGTVAALGCYRHMNASASWGEGLELDMQLNPDDRMGMSFPPYIFDADNNRGGS